MSRPQIDLSRAIARLWRVGVCPGNRSTTLLTCYNSEGLTRCMRLTVCSAAARATWRCLPGDVNQRDGIESGRALLAPRRGCSRCAPRVRAQWIRACHSLAERYAPVTHRDSPRSTRLTPSLRVAGARAHGLPRGAYPEDRGCRLLEDCAQFEACRRRRVSSRSRWPRMRLPWSTGLRTGAGRHRHPGGPRGRP